MDKQLDDQNFMAYLKEHYPYLWEVEARVMEVKQKGFGDVSVSLKIRSSEVEKISVLWSEDKILLVKRNNKFSSAFEET